MESQMTWGMALVLVALAAAHMVEESIAELRSVPGVPRRDQDGLATRLADLPIDRIGLGLLLAALAASGVLVDRFWMWVALGIVAADLVTHAAASLVAKAYIPGVATSAACFVYLLGVVVPGQNLLDHPSAWGAIVIGLAFVTILHLSGQHDRRAQRDGPARS